MKQAWIILMLTLVFTCKYAYAQGQSTSLDELAAAIQRWDESFNAHDTTAFYGLMDDDIVFTAGGGSDIGISAVKETVRGLYETREGIAMHMTPDQMEPGDMGLAYDTGTWKETWIGMNINSTSVMRGKYWRMWNMAGDQYKVVAIILTPLSWNK